MSTALVTSRISPVVVEAVGEAGQVTHRVGVPKAMAGGLRKQLRAALPDLVLTSTERAGLPLQQAITVTLSTRRRSLDVDATEHAVDALTTAIAAAGREECIVLQWILRGSRAPLAVPNDYAPGAESWPTAVMDAVRIGGQPLDAEARQALRVKRRLPEWHAIGRIAVRAANEGRGRQLIGGVLAALRTLEGPGVAVGGRRASSRAVVDAATWRWPLRLNTAELAVLAAWPVNDATRLPIAASRHRLIRPTKAVADSGRIVGVSDVGDSRRRIGITTDDSLRHLHIVGPTGTGKSHLMLNLIRQDIADGRGVIVVEPKGDLITEILGYVPDGRRDQVVVVDPTADQPAGLNPLHAGGRPPELVADQLLAVFHGLYADSWGPRTQDILGAALVTLARTPGMTVAALPLLLTDDAFRSRIVNGITDPLGVAPFWRAFNAWTPAERTTATAPVLNKVRPFLVRPSLRHLIGQAEPLWNFTEALAKRQVVLVNLAKGSIGPEAATLLGSLVISQLWQAIQGRNALPAARRAPVGLYLDEFADYLRLPVDLADALMLSRSTGVYWTIAHQHLRQLPADLRGAVLANARSRVVFQPHADEARDFAGHGSSLDTDDFLGLPAYHAYAQLMGGGSVQPWCSLRALAAPKQISSPVAVRYQSAKRFGVDPALVDEALTALTAPDNMQPMASPDDLRPRRRRPGGPS